MFKLAENIAPPGALGRKSRGQAHGRLWTHLKLAAHPSAGQRRAGYGGKSSRSCAMLIAIITCDRRNSGRMRPIANPNGKAKPTRCRRISHFSFTQITLSGWNGTWKTPWRGCLFWAAQALSTAQSPVCPALMKPVCLPSGLPKRTR